MVRGRKCTWLAGKTDTVRVPVSAMVHVLTVCRMVDTSDPAEFDANWNRIYEALEKRFQKMNKVPTNTAKAFVRKPGKKK